MNTTNRRLWIRRHAVWACAALLAGCAASPSAPPVLLSLPPAVATSAPPAAPAVSATAAPPLLAIRRVGIPEYLVARRVRYRADASTLAEWPNTFWAERIEIGVSRELVSALRQQLPGWAVCESNCGELQPAVALQVEMVPMDFVRSTHRLQARARITLSGGSSAHVLSTEERVYDLPATADTPQAHAQAMTELIRQVAQAAAPLVLAAKP
jgi:uncharacterized lipoprotein YmbA